MGALDLDAVRDVDAGEVDCLIVVVVKWCGCVKGLVGEYD
jgi:hypothetical protein